MCDVVPANAGTHNHRLDFMKATNSIAPQTGRGVWVPACAGTTLDTQLRAGHQNVAGDLAGAGGEFVAQAPRRGGVTFEPRLEQSGGGPGPRKGVPGYGL